MRKDFAAVMRPFTLRSRWPHIFMVDKIVFTTEFNVIVFTIPHGTVPHAQYLKLFHRLDSSHA